jgi:hypothetical protein
MHPVILIISRPDPSGRRILDELAKASIDARPVTLESLSDEEAKSVAALEPSLGAQIVRLHTPGGFGRARAQEMIFLASCLGPALMSMHRPGELDLLAMKLPEPPIDELKNNELKKISLGALFEHLEPIREEKPFWREIGVNSKRARKMFPGNVRNARR